MARRVFFSFHYQNDIWRVNQVRNSHVVEGCAAAGFQDASLWEEARRRGDAAVKRLIDQGLEGTTVTAVLIGEQTAYRRYVDYEIDRSLARGNGLIGVRIHNLRDQYGRSSLSGPVPQRLVAFGAPVYTWSDARSFGAWVETAYQGAQGTRLNPFRI
ncbi:TIR domain-containing protein [soil metagenome]